MLRFLTAGESHGRGLIGIIEGMPAGVQISEDFINYHLVRRMKGYGRGGRMAIETDSAEIISGVRGGYTLGSPISFMISNRDHSNWKEVMAAGAEAHTDERVVKRPRPGHADLAGAIKYRHEDMRNVLERASARETACRVAAGAFFRKMLEPFNIYIYSQVIAIGEISSVPAVVTQENLAEFLKLNEESPVRCNDKQNAEKMIKLIDSAREAGESLGGCFEVGALGVPPGLGSHVSWDRKLDADLAGLLMSIPAIKAVEIGDGIKNSQQPGSKVHDEIHYSETTGIFRVTNHAGGTEGGISNGETIWARAYMKPIPTLYKPLVSVNTSNWTEEKADIERSDVCAVPAAAVVGEAMLAFGIARAMVNKFGGDSIEQMEQNYISYCDYMKKVWRWERI
ncbi:MAG: chorismate synthase [Syntrophomonadaceae bacterium]